MFFTRKIRIYFCIYNKAEAYLNLKHLKKYLLQENVNIVTCACLTMTILLHKVM